jgi:uncharacterized protein YecT (DUF1311 family)
MQSMRWWSSPTLLLVAMLSPVAGFAVDECKNATTQVVMDRCNDLRYRRLDRELNRVYRETLSRLPPQEQQRLRTDQRAWLHEREAQCARVWKDGAWDKAVWERIECESAMTQTRTDELRTWRAR